MSIVYVTGNVVDSDADVLVVTVNCVGAMGKGVALDFKQRFPALLPPYQTACRSGALRPGHVLFLELAGANLFARPQVAACLATKAHWRDSSRYEWVEAGLVALASGVASRGMRSVALPPPGCGNGGLNWERVRPMVEAAFAAHPEIEVRVYAAPPVLSHASPAAHRPPLVVSPAPTAPRPSRWRGGFPPRS